MFFPLLTLSESDNYPTLVPLKLHSGWLFHIGDSLLSAQAGAAYGNLRDGGSYTGSYGNVTKRRHANPHRKPA